LQTFTGRNPNQPPKVLIVDPDVRVLHQLTAVLHDRYQIHEATTFPAARGLWNMEFPDVLIADVRLGEFNGLQLLMRAREERPDLIAVITCAFPDRVLEAETRRLGGTFLVKPVPPQQVLATIDGALVQRTSTPEKSTEQRTDDRRQAGMTSYFPDRRIAERRRART
jgi:two-component system response regulator RegA